MYYLQETSNIIISETKSERKFIGKYILGKQRKAGMAMLISDKGYIRAKKMPVIGTLYNDKKFGSRQLILNVRKI